MSLFTLVRPAVFTAVFTLSSYAAVMTNYYVDPVNGSDGNTGTSPGVAFLTLAKARDAVRTHGTMTGDIVVNLRGGLHTLGDTLKFGPPDGGTDGYLVIWQNYGNEKPIISGGKRITGWKVHSGGIYKAGVGATPNSSRSLFINGIRCQRAMGELYPAGFSRTGNIIKAPSSGFYSTMSGWRNIQDIEIMSTMVWAVNYIRVAGISGTTLTMQQPAMDAANAYGPGFDTWAARVENAYELLNLPGEWYLDRTKDTIYYYPRAGENLSTDTAMLANIEVAVFGDAVQNLKFKGLEFSYCDFKRITNSPYCFIGCCGFVTDSGGAWHNQFYGASHVYFMNSKNITFDRLKFTHMGSNMACFEKGCKNISVTGCLFLDGAEGGIRFGNYNNPGGVLYGNYHGGNFYVDSNLTCSCNYFAELGCEFWGAVPISVGHVKYLTIQSNEMIGCTYNGMYFSAVERPPEEKNLVNTNVTIYKNRVVGYGCSPLSDGGGIYFAGPYPNTMIRENFVSRGQKVCFYPDEESAYLNWVSNVADCTPQWSFMWTPTIHDVHFSDNFSVTESRENNGTNCTVTNTVTETTAQWPDAPWKSAAANLIINRSGLDSTMYADIRPASGTNLARKATVSASTSTETGGYSKASLVDGKRTSIPSAMGYSSTASDSAGVTLDLGSSQTINRIELWPVLYYPSWAVGKGFPKNFRIETSTNNANWTLVVKEEGAKNPWFTSKVYYLRNITCRYVRLTATVLSDGVLQLAEFEVFGGPMTSVLPCFGGYGFSGVKAISTIVPVNENVTSVPVTGQKNALPAAPQAGNRVTSEGKRGATSPAGAGGLPRGGYVTFVEAQPGAAAAAKTAASAADRSLLREKTVFGTVKMQGRLYHDGTTVSLFSDTLKAPAATVATFSDGSFSLPCKAGGGYILVMRPARKLAGQYGDYSMSLTVDDAARTAIGTVTLRKTAPGK